MIGTQRRPSEHQGMQYMDWSPSVRIPKSHPLSEKIYGSESDAQLLASIEKNGVLEPIIVRGGTNEILSGNRRWAVLKMLSERHHPDDPDGKYGHVPAVVFDGSDVEAELILIESNSQRVKTDLQIQNEVRELTRIESALAKQRQQEGGRNKVKVNSTEPSKGSTVSKVAGATGESESKTKERMAINTAVDKGDTAPLEVLREGGSVHAAAEVIGKRRTCQHCGAKFATQTQRKKHERKAHPEESYVRPKYARQECEEAAKHFSPPRPRPQVRPVVAEQRIDPELAKEIVNAGKRALAMKSHPDQGGSNDAMTELNTTADWLLELIEKSHDGLRGVA